MGRPISLFTNYSQSENRVTNYCGLMMKLIYEESPRRFQELLALLLPSSHDVAIGPQFEQQRNYGTSVPDLVISQQAFTILFETKLSDWHYKAQIDRHVQSISRQEGKLLIFLLSNGETDTAARLEEETTKHPHIELATLTYETLINAIESVCQTDSMISMATEFRQFLDESDLLPRWRILLDVVNCGNSPNELAADAFFCPNTGRSYSHRRARWFGAYAGKEVSSIHEIDAVVIVGKGGGTDGTSIIWKNNPQDDSDLLKKAIELVNRFRLHQINDVALQVFLLGAKAHTSFRKISSGGIRSKCYIYDKRFNTDTVEYMARLLRDELKTWPSQDIETEGLD